jgi:hypothetical protein
VTGSNRDRSKRESAGRSRLILLAAIGVVIILAVALLPRIFAGGSSSRATATPTTQAAAFPASRTPTFTVPTPAIPVPKSCPPDTVPGVDNSDRYGFCIPTGWGAWNNNNSIPTTQIIKARQGDSPILQPTDFDRIQVVVSLDTGPPGDAVPADCKGAPNDAIDGLAAHHCTAALNPDNNPYHATKAGFWMIDLFGNRRFYMTALFGGDTTPDDDAVVDMVVHNVKPPGSQ